MSEKTVKVLAAEVERIISSPYAVALANLRVILRDTDYSSLEEWAANYHQQLRPLAEAIAEGLQSWPYVLEIFRILAPLTPFRDAIIECAPSLLTSLINKALSTNQENDAARDLCVQLLSHPLPSHLLIPENAQALLCHFLENAIQEPSVVAIEPIYTLLSGACHELLEILPRETLNRLQGCLVKMVRTIKHVEDQSLSLLCFAVMAKLSKCNSKISEDVRDFFGPERASKTVHLLILQVIYACKEELNELPLLTCRRVQLASECLTAIRLKAQHACLKQDDPVMRKLYEKVVLPNMRDSLRLDVLAFISGITKIQHVPDKVIDVFQSMILQTGFRSPLEQFREEAFHTVISFFATRLNQSFWEAIVQILLLQCVRPSECRSSTDSMLSNLASQITKDILTQPQIQNRIFLALTSRPELLKELMKMPVEDLVSDRRSLILEVANLILNLRLLTAASTCELSSMVSLGALHLYQRLQHHIPRTMSHNIHTAIPFSFGPRTEAPLDRGWSQNWKNILATKLREEGENRQDMIERLVGDVCRDLEERCKHVEEPIREWEAKFENLYQDHTQLQDLFKAQRTALRDFEVDLGTVRKQLELREVELSDQFSKNADLLASHEELSDHMVKVVAEREQELCNERDKHMELELELRANIACKIEVIDHQQNDVVRLQERLRSHQVSAAEEGSRFKILIDSLQGQLLDANETLRLQIETNSVKNCKYSKLEAENLKLQELKTDLENQVKNARENHSVLSAELVEIKNELQGRMEQLNAKHKAEISAIEVKATESENLAKVVIHQLEGNLAECEQEHSIALQKKDNRIRALEEEAQASSIDRQRKREELEEAHKLKARLLEAMGLQSTREDNAFKIDRSNNTILPSYNDAEKCLTMDISTNSSLSEVIPGLEYDKAIRIADTGSPQILRKRYLGDTPANRTFTDSKSTSERVLSSMTSRQVNGISGDVVPPKSDKFENHIQVISQNKEAKSCKPLFLGDLSFGGSGFFTSEEVSPYQADTFHEVDENADMTNEL